MEIENIVKELSKHHKTIKDVEIGVIDKNWVNLFNETYRVEDYTNEIGMAMVSKQLVAYRKSVYDNGVKTEKIYNKHPIDVYARLVKIKESYKR